MIKYRVYKSNQDDTLVFLHGYADSMDMYYPFIDNFPEYKIVLINFPIDREGEEKKL